MAHTVTGTSGNDVLQAQPGAGGNLVLVASGTRAEGIWPTVNVLVNGSVVLANVSVTANHAAGATQQIVVPIAAGTAVTSLTLHYTNDTQTVYDFEDRNVFLSSVTLNGTALPLSAGTYVRFDGSPAPSGWSNADLVWGGTLTFSGAVVQNAMGGGGVQHGTVVNGLEGIDTAVYHGARAEYIIDRNADGSYAVYYSGGGDTLVNMERVHFNDAKFAIDVSGNGGMAYRLYQAAFDRAPDTGGLGYWINALDQGAGLAPVAQAFINSAEFQVKFGSPGNDQYVTLLYQNVLHRGPDQAGLHFWVNNLNTGAITRAETLVYFSESPENQAALIGVIEDGMAYA